MPKSVFADTPQGHMQAQKKGMDFLDLSTGKTPYAQRAGNPITAVSPSSNDYAPSQPRRIPLTAPAQAERKGADVDEIQRRADELINQ